MNSSVRNAVLWLTVLCLGVLVYVVFRGTKAPGDQPVFTELVRKVNSGEVDSVVINSMTGDVAGKYKNGDEFHSTVPPTYDNFLTLLIDKGVKAKVEKDTNGLWTNILGTLLPVAMLVGFWFFMARQMQSGGNKALSFGKSRARLHTSQQKCRIQCGHE